MSILATEAPVGVNVCKCGHAKREHHWHETGVYCDHIDIYDTEYGVGREGCDCDRFQLGAVPSSSETTQELRVPPAAAEWRAEQGLPPIAQHQRPPSPGCHRLKEWRALMRMPENFPFKPTVVHELNDGLEYDEYGVVVLPEKKDSSFWRHAARHTARGVRS